MKALKLNAAVSSSITSENILLINNKAWLQLEKRLNRSKFRSRFKLGKPEIEYLQSRGMDIVQTHAFDFIRQRLAPSMPRNDGKQTPMKGHPVFIAQHATGTCCRTCLRKWHGIQEGTELTDRQIQYVVSILMRWILANAQITEGVKP
jgi:exodeoxyribonuclease V alpha subunit